MPDRLSGMVGRVRPVAAVVLVAVLAAVALCYALVPRRYTATAMVTVLPRPGSAAGGSFAGTSADTVAHLSRTPPLVARIAADLGVRRSAATLEREIVGARLPGTAIVAVRVTDGNAGVAAHVANAVVAELPLFDPTAGRLVFTDAGRATPPGAPSSPTPTPFVLLGIALVVAASAVMSALSAAGGRVRRGEDVRRAGVPLLAHVTAPPDLTGLPVVSAGPAMADFRRLRVALEFAGSQAPTRVIVVAPASDDPSAGWLSVNLAASLAQVHHRVLLVDADSGDRRKHPAFDVPGDGLAEVLAGSLPLCHAVVPCGAPGVSVLPLGSAKLLEADALLEVGFGAVFAELDADVFDVAVVLAPPLDESDDARVMAAGNSVVVAVSAGRTGRRALVQGLADLRRMGLRVLGATLCTGARG